MGGSEIVVGENIRDGLAALREEHDRAEVVGGDDPYLLVDLGRFDLTSYPYDQDEARVFIRVHKDFPSGRHYGLFTIPVLTVDGDQPDNTEKNHQHGQPLSDAGIDGDYLQWSRDWQEVPFPADPGPEEMAKAPTFVRGTLRNPMDT